MADNSSSTRVDRVFAEIRADILAGRSRPGTRLRLADLVKRHEASMGVVREALSRISSQGLVENEPQHGFRVVAISQKDLRHLTDARCSIEVLVLRQAIEHGDLTWEGEVLAAHHTLSRVPEMDRNDPERLSEEWTGAHAAFHAALLRGCPNPRLLDIAASLRDSAELYRRWSVPLGHDGRDIAGEHRALLEAVLERDAERAALELTKHIRHTTQVLLDNAEFETAED
ncbi:GntR family transcriptional regulator [Streptomyces flaveolus]|uniref:GntR family transcriptional regulator n=1 Tax=Streptomyces flaveolus TaxID=67297 RepID=UPI0033F03A37